MAIKLIDTSARNMRPKKSGPPAPSSKLRLFVKTALITFTVTLGILILFTLAVSVLLYPKAKALAGQVEETYSQAERFEVVLKEKDIKQSEIELKKLEGELKETRRHFDSLSFVRFIPILASYYNDGKHLLNAADLGVALGEKSLLVVEPFGDILGFKGAPEDISAEVKAEKVVTQVLPKLIPLIDDIETTLEKIEDEIVEISEAHYPENFEVKGFNVRDGLKQAKEGLNLAQEIIPEVKPLLKEAPQVLGNPEQKTYLVLLQNDKELRATGGFITSYALVKIKDGRLLEVESDDIYQLDLKYRRTEPSPEAIRKYIGHNSLPIRDSNFSPDYLESAKKFEEMYNTIKGMPKIDGVFALDTEFVRTIIEVTGPITTEKTKETFSAEKNKLGIPDVVYKLELYSEKIFGGQDDRKRIIGELMDALIEKVLSAKPEEFPTYFEAIQKTVNEKHLLFYFHNETFQDFAEKYNGSGRIKDYDGDYFHLNNSNFGGLKGNLYIKQKVEQDIQISESGEITKKVDVTLTNPAKADGWLNSIYLNWMRIYVPKGSELVTKKVQKDFTSGVELGKEVYRGYGATYPLNFSVSSFTYKLPFKYQEGEPYKMLIQKQPGVEEIEMIIKINGVKKEEFKLRTDKELIINL